MNTALLRKELRGQWPFLFLGVALLVIEVFALLVQQWDHQPLSTTFSGFNYLFVFQFLMSFAVGSGLLMREIDDGSLTFLDGLPLTRAQAFGSKMTVAAAVLLCYPLGHWLLIAALHMLSRESLDYTLNTGMLAASFALMVLLTAVGISCGVLLGFLRSLAWATLALLTVMLEALSISWPRLSTLNPVEALKINAVGANIKLPVEGIAVQMGFALLFGLSAFWLFQRAGADRRRLQLYLSRPLISAIVTGVTIAALFGALALYGKKQGDGPTEFASDLGTAIFQHAPPGHSQTLHYTFSYPAPQAESVQPLLLHADEVFGEVAAQLRIEGGESIDVDLSGSEANTEGTAFFDRIRMFPGGELPLSTLAHETTHVFAQRLAGGENERELTRMPAFNEGLARWVEQRIALKSGVSDRDRRQAAIVSQRHMVAARDLTDVNALARNVDRNLIYPLGAVIIDALVSRYGVEAPKKVLLTLGRPDFPRDLDPYALWQSAFQLSGFDLSLVFDDYARRLKEWEAKFAGFIGELPRPRGSLVRGNERVGVAVRLDAALPAGWHVVVRFRPRDNSELRDYVTRTVKNGVAWLALSRISNERACFQPGINAEGIVIYEAWVCLPLDSAAASPD